MSRPEYVGVRESDSEYIIEAIEGAIVEALCFSYTLVLKLQGTKDRGFRVNIEQPFQCFIEGSWQEVNPENSSTCHRVFGLHNDIVTASSVLKSGELRMAFKSGAKLVAGFNENYESWTFAMGSNYKPEESWLLICMPGGDIAVFA